MFKSAFSRLILLVALLIGWSVVTAILFGFKTSTMLIYASAPVWFLGAFWAGNGEV